MKKEQRKTRITSLMALLVFAVFAVCVLAVLLTGADVYQRLTERERLGYDKRTAAQYITTRVRQADRLGGVSVERFGGVDALVLLDEIDGELYETRIYCCEGYIRELFTEAGSDLAPEDGEKLLKAETLRVTLEGSVLRAELVVAAGETQYLTWYLRSGEGAIP